MDNEVYGGPVDITVGEGESLQLRARVGARPVIRILDTHVDKREALTVKGAGCFILDGLLVEGRGVEVRGDVRELQSPLPGAGLNSMATAIPNTTKASRGLIPARRSASSIRSQAITSSDDVANAPYRIRVADILDGSRPSQP
jgi:hypothetical protein